MIIFAVQFFFSCLLAVFCLYKLRDGPPDPLWVSLLTSTVAIWLPTPVPGGVGAAAGARNV